MFDVMTPKAIRPEEDIGTNRDLQEEGLDWLDERKPLWEEKTMQYLVYVRQRGTETGRLHWQGYVQFKAKGGIRKAVALKRLGRDGWEGSLRAMRGTAQECQDYIMKDEKKTNLEEPVECGEVDLSIHATAGPGQGARTDLQELGKRIMRRELTKSLLIAEAPDLWQRMNKPLVHFLAEEMKARPMPVCSEKKDLLARKTRLKEADEAIAAYLSGPSNRKIVWLWSHEGDSGKSELLKHWRNKLKEEKKEVYFSTGGKAWDVARGYEAEPVVIIDCPRDCEMVPYGFMEGVLNGYVCSTKQYVAIWTLKTYGHVIVGGNDPPNTTLMSKDRWVTICLDEAVPVPVGAVPVRV